MRKNSLKNFDHVERKVINAPMTKRELIQVKRMEKGRGRPKIKLVKLVKIDMSNSKKECIGPTLTALLRIYSQP